MYGSQRALSWEMESSYCLAIADVPNPGALVSWHSKGAKKKKNVFQASLVSGRDTCNPSL